VSTHSNTTSRRKTTIRLKESQRPTKDDEPVVANVRITNPNRVVFPEQKLTKVDVARYYERVADWILPHLVDRPLTLVRCPNGRDGQCFYQKHLTASLPDTVRGVMIKGRDSRDEYVVIDDLVGLISLVQIGVLEFHPWAARSNAIERPDRLVFDLDPGEGVPWKQVVDGATEVRDLLQGLGLTSFLRTSGGKGLHVVLPLTRRNSWDELIRFAKSVTDRMVKAAPEHYIGTMSKAKRKGKVFIDYFRNQRGATAIASYSTRARRGAPVATPLAWEELTTRVKADAFRVDNVPKRLESQRAEPWANFFTTKQSITNRLLAFIDN
jgi:bifunctional non-homologous end joining protein LigD